MNKRQKELLILSGRQERGIVYEIEKVFGEALSDIDEKIQILDSKIQTESVLNRRKFQEALKRQVEETYTKLQDGIYMNIDSYIKECYEDGFLGAMYDLHGQGIPLMIPINQQDILNAVLNDTKLSKPLYEALGYNVSTLVKNINSEIARGVAMSSTYMDMARNINTMNRVGMNKALTIARTEGHRVRIQSTFDAQKKAKDRGANIVKQWDSTMDRNTRPTHQQLDGQIRELEDDFVIPSTGKKAPHPAGFGIAKEDINCRCALLQRAKWALDDDELETLKEKAEYFGLDKTKDFEDFKKKYLKNVEPEESGDVRIEKFENWYGKKHGKAMKEKLDKAPKLYQDAWNDSYDEFNALNPAYRGSKAYYQPSTYKSNRGVMMNILSDSKGSSYQSPYQVVFHEFGHHMDYAMNLNYGDKDPVKAFTQIYKNGAFGDTLKEEAMDAVRKFTSDYIQDNLDFYRKQSDDRVEAMLRRGILTADEVTDETKLERFENWLKRVKNDPVSEVPDIVKKFADDIKDKYTLMERSDISDMFEQTLKIKYPFGVGHGLSYWGSGTDRLGKEAFAEMYSATLANKGSLNVIKKFFPKSFELFEEILGVVNNGT